MQHKNNRLKVITRLSEAATAQLNHLKLLSKVDNATLFNAAIGCLYQVTLAEIQREQQRLSTSVSSDTTSEASTNEEGNAGEHPVQPQASESGVEAE